MARIQFGESALKSILGAQTSSVDITAEYDEYSHSGKYTDGILLCESHDVTLLRVAKAADQVQEELEGKVSDMEMFAEGTFGDKGFFKGIWDFIVKCFTAVVDWVKSIFGKFVKVTEKTVKELEKVSNEFRVKAEKLGKEPKLAFTSNSKVTFFKFPETITTPELNAFIAHSTLNLGINVLWDTTALKSFKFAKNGATAETIFEKDIADTLRTAVQAGAAAGDKATTSAYAVSSANVKSAVEALRNSQESGGFESSNKEKKLKYFLNGLITDAIDATFKTANAFRLSTNDSDENGKLSAKDEFVKVFFDYQEHVFNGSDECNKFVKNLIAVNGQVYLTLKEMVKVKNKLSEGAKYFENIKKEYEKISSGFTSAAKSMRSSTASSNEAARGNANDMSGFLEEVSKITSWYTSNVINTYAIADLCIGKSAANLIGALNLGINTISNVETVETK